MMTNTKTDDRPARFVRELARLERGPLAQLRRGLGEGQGTYWLERLFAVTGYGESGPRTKEALGLLAGLYALKPQARDEVDGEEPDGPDTATDAGRARDVPSIGTLMAAVHLEQNRVGGRLPGDASSTEKRFLGLLDADWEGLPHHLRQAVTLLQAQDLTPDWENLAADLLALSRGVASADRVHKRWAQDFYREIGQAQAAMQKASAKSGGGDGSSETSIATSPNEEGAAP